MATLLTTPMTMSDSFLTIKEASEKYGKAEITIRRLVRSIVQSENSDHRQYISPDPEEVKRLKKRSKPFTYSVSGELLESKYGASSESATSSSSNKAAAMNENKEYVDLLMKTNSSLEEQMRVKDEQIRALNDSLDSLGERNRETNILMRGLQEQFLLNKGTKKDVVDAELNQPEPVEAAVAGVKRRWWQRWAADE